MYIDRYNGKFIYRNSFPSLDEKGIYTKNLPNTIRLTRNFQTFISAIGLTGPFAVVLRTASNSLYMPQSTFPEIAYIFLRGILVDYYKVTSMLFLCDFKQGYEQYNKYNEVRLMNYGLIEKRIQLLSLGKNETDNVMDFIYSQVD